MVRLSREGGLDLGHDRAVIGDLGQWIGARLLREERVRTGELIAQQARLAQIVLQQLLLARPAQEFWHDRAM